MLSLPTAPGVLPKPTPDDPMLLQKMYAALQKASEAGDEGAVQQMQEGIQQHIADKIRPQEATEGMSKGGVMLAGMGAGADKVWEAGKSVANSLNPFSSAESKQDPDIEDAANVLEKTPQGQVGSAIGENAAEGLVGYGVGKVLGGAAKLRALSKILSSGTVRAGAEGAAMGAVSTTDPDEQLERAGEGGLAGGAIHYGIGKLRRLSKGISGVTPEARQLREKGVDLTVGQSAPGSKLGAAEESSAATGGFGPIVKDQRERALRDWQDLTLAKAHAPYETVPGRESGLDIHERLNDANEGFGRSYDKAVAGAKMPAAVTPTSPPLHYTLLHDAVDDPTVMATDEQRNMVRSWLKNQLTTLDGLNNVPAEQLQTMRSNIRKEAMASMKAGDTKVAALLHNANDQVTEVLDAHLPPKQASRLRSTDKAYGNYKTVEGTVARAKDSPEGFTPTMLQNTVAENTPKGAYARGGGNALRELAKAGKATLDAKSPMTGVRLLGRLPGVGPYGTAGLSALSNYGPIKRALLGETGIQKLGQDAEAALTSRMSKAARERTKRALQLGSAVAGNKLTQDDK